MDQFFYSNQIINDSIILPEDEAIHALKVLRKKVGDQINEGDILCEVETDKTTMEIPSTINGILKEIIVQENETVAVGTILGIMEQFFLIK